MGSTYFDFDLFAESSPDGGIDTKAGIDSFYVALTGWLTSRPNDYIRNSTQGGVLSRHIDKPLSPDRGETIRIDILSGLQVDFSPALTVYSLKVTPDYQNDAWVIEILGYLPELKWIVKYDQSFKRPAGAA